MGIVDRILLHLLERRGYEPAMLMAPRRDEDVAAEQEQTAQLKAKVDSIYALANALGVRVESREERNYATRHHQPL